MSQSPEQTLRAALREIERAQIRLRGQIGTAPVYTQGFVSGTIDTIIDALAIARSALYEIEKRGEEGEYG